MGQNETTTNELLLRIKEKYKKMSKGQRRLADYVCNDYDKAVFLTAAKLGEIVGVSAVSYTHLDVYKRQWYMHGKMQRSV